MQMMKRTKKNRVFYSLIALLSIVFVSCVPSVPGKYIQPDDMEDILYDYHLTQAIAGNQHNSDTSAYLKNAYYYSVLKRHGVSEADFDSSLVYYYTNAKRLHDIYRNITERMNNEAMAYGASSGVLNQYSQYKSDGDTANVWTEAVASWLTPDKTRNRFDFEITADTTYMLGDSFMFNFMSTFMYQSGTKDATAYISVSYENDSIDTYSRRVTVSGLTQIRMRANTKSKVKGITGFIYLNRGNDDSKTLKLLFIDQIQLIRFHPEKKDEIKSDNQGLVIKRENSADSVRSNVIISKTNNITSTKLNNKTSSTPVKSKLGTQPQKLKGNIQPLN